MRARSERFARRGFSRSHAFFPGHARARKASRSVGVERLTESRGPYAGVYPRLPNPLSLYTGMRVLCINTAHSHNSKLTGDATSTILSVAAGRSSRARANEDSRSLCKCLRLVRSTDTEPSEGTRIKEFCELYYYYYYSSTTGMSVLVRTSTAMIL